MGELSFSIYRQAFLGFLRCMGGRSILKLDATGNLILIGETTIDDFPQFQQSKQDIKYIEKSDFWTFHVNPFLKRNLFQKITLGVDIIIGQ